MVVRSNRGIESAKKREGGKDDGVPSSFLWKKRAKEEFRGEIPRRNRAFSGEIAGSSTAVIRSKVYPRRYILIKFRATMKFWFLCKWIHRVCGRSLSFSLFLSLQLYGATTGRSPIKPGKIRLNIFAPWLSRYEFSNEQSNEPLRAHHLTRN